MGRSTVGGRLPNQATEPLPSRAPLRQLAAVFASCKLDPGYFLKSAIKSSPFNRAGAVLYRRVRRETSALERGFLLTRSIFANLRPSGNPLAGLQPLGTKSLLQQPDFIGHTFLGK